MTKFGLHNHKSTGLFSTGAALLCKKIRMRQKEDIVARLVKPIKASWQLFGIGQQ
jgi:hypothetical protein